MSHAAEWLRPLREFLADQDSPYERVLLRLLDDFLADPTAPPNELVALLGQHRRLEAECGPLNSGTDEVAAVEAKMDAMWDRIESTTGGAA